MQQCIFWMSNLGGWRMNWVFLCLAGFFALIGAGAAVEALSEARDRVRFPPPGSMVDVGGRRLHLLCKGTHAGPTVVIEQGAGSPSIFWWPIQDKVASFSGVCTYDRAGYLWSDPAASSRDLEERVQDLHALLANGNVPGPYIMVGHSFGGPIIRLYTRNYPAEVAGMVLVDTPEEQVILRPSYDDYVKKLGYFATTFELAARVGLVRLAAAFLQKVPDGLDAGAYDALKAGAVRPDFFRAMRDDPVSLSRNPATLRALSGAGSLGNKPLVVITHCLPFPGPAAVLEDGWLDGQHRLAALSTRGELVLAEHSNHMIQSEQPDIIIAAIQRVVALVGD
jgi:pimeloyl-ACP methyl ester carboxylesterase